MNGSIDARPSDAVALLRGPLVLMPVKPDQTSPLPKVTREQLMAAKRGSGREWRIDATNEPLAMRPFYVAGITAVHNLYKLS